MNEEMRLGRDRSPSISRRWDENTPAPGSPAWVEQVRRGWNDALAWDEEEDAAPEPARRIANVPAPTNEVRSAQPATTPEAPPTGRSVRTFGLKPAPPTELGSSAEDRAFRRRIIAEFEAAEARATIQADDGDREDTTTAAHAVAPAVSARRSRP
jgi:hypothetical protein